MTSLPVGFDFLDRNYRYKLAVTLICHEKSHTLAENLFLDKDRASAASLSTSLKQPTP